MAIRHSKLIDELASKDITGTQSNMIAFARRRLAIKSSVPKVHPIHVGPLKQSELEEADRIVRLAFGTFLGVPNPLEFMGDRNFMTPRWRSKHVKVVAAREGGRLIGSNVATRWGSFGFFGPLTVLPEYWDRGVAQRLLKATMTIFEKWGVRHTPGCLRLRIAPNTLACTRSSATGRAISLLS